MTGLIVTMPDPWGKTDFNLSDLTPRQGSEVITGAGKSTINYPVINGGVGKVRRPYSGVSVKPNTSAYVTVVDGFGVTKRVFNDMGSTMGSSSTPTKTKDDAGNAPRSKAWTDFLLQSVNESRVEKFQIFETFGAPILYVFGERPRTLDFSVVLLNTTDFNWRAEFFENWERFFRATRLAESNSRMYISWDDILVGGYPLNAQVQQTATDPTRVSMSFSFFVTSYTNVAINNMTGINSLNDGASDKIPYVTRLAEFLETGTYSDTSYLLGGDDTIGRYLAGPNLRFMEWFESKKAILSGIGVGDLSLYELIFSPQSAYIKNTNTALEVVLSYMRRKVNEAAYQGVEELNRSASGGALEVSFWFGLVAQLYRLAMINGLNAIGARDGVPPSRWINMIDHVATLGNPYAVASYLGYTSDLAASSALYGSATDRFSSQNLRYTASTGLVSSTPDSNALYRQSEQASSFGFNTPNSEQRSTTNDTVSLLKDKKSSDEEAARALQGNSPKRYSAMSLVEDDEF